MQTGLKNMMWVK